MATALMGDGFYSFDINGGLTSPFWYDEYSVNASGVATEDRSRKGYLGQALTGAVELTNAGTLIFEDTFDTDTIELLSFSFSCHRFGIGRQACHQQPGLDVYNGEHQPGFA